MIAPNNPQVAVVVGPVGELGHTVVACRLDDSSARVVAVDRKAQQLAALPDATRGELTNGRRCPS
jgi:hypothetical protein